MRGGKRNGLPERLLKNQVVVGFSIPLLFTGSALPNRQPRHPTAKRTATFISRSLEPENRWQSRLWRTAAIVGRFCRSMLSDSARIPETVQKIAIVD